MAILSEMMNVLEQYKGGNQSGSANAEQDFDRVAEHAPQEHLAGGLSNYFNSSSTPAFADTVSHLFNNSNGEQKAGILNNLLQAAGPSLGGGLMGMLGGGSGGQVTPEQAQNISSDAVREAAAHAEKNNPSIVDQASSFYAQHPTLVKALGAGALAMVMSHMSKRG